MKRILLKNIFLLPIILFATVFSSCGKKWKQTTKANFSFSVNEGTTPSGLHFTGGNFRLTEVHFTGSRKQGGNVDFTNHPNSNLNLATGGSDPVVVYDIPQGTYKNIQLEFRTDQENDSTPSMILTGQYINLAHDTFQVYFDFEASEIFRVQAQSNNAGQEITMIEGTPATVSVILDSEYWFDLITSTQLDNADQIMLNGKPSIIINESDNSDIYQSVSSRISESTKAVFH
jgi:hypothetical protein